MTESSLRAKSEYNRSTDSGVIFISNYTNGMGVDSESSDRNINSVAL